LSHSFGKSNCAYGAVEVAKLNKSLEAIIMKSVMAFDKSDNAQFCHNKYRSYKYHFANETGLIVLIVQLSLWAGVAFMDH
jgi:hypothetical protein